IIDEQPPICSSGRLVIEHWSAQILSELVYEVDISVLPGTDLSREFGPDFAHCSAQPYWFGTDPALLEIPLTVGYTGLLAQIGRPAHVLTMHPWLKAVHIPGVLARLHLIDRIPLTPEG